MKKIKLSLLASLLLLTLSVCAGNSPAKVQKTFKKMYPEVTDAGWLRKSDYHIAEFSLNNHEMCAWFNDNGKWIMTEMDVESLEEVPVPVAKAFKERETPPIEIDDIRIITFPKMPTVIIIDIEEYNSNKEYQLFYAPDGTLLQTYDVTGGNGEIYPELFG